MEWEIISPCVSVPWQIYHKECNHWALVKNTLKELIGKRDPLIRDKFRCVNCLKSIPEEILFQFFLLEL